jgi:hypothetical protein
MLQKAGQEANDAVLVRDSTAAHVPHEGCKHFGIVHGPIREKALLRVGQQQVEQPASPFQARLVAHHLLFAKPPQA